MAQRPTSVDIFNAVKRTTADHEMFLFYLKIETRKIKDLKRNESSEFALVQGIELFLNNHCENREWEMVADSLQECNDLQTAEEIRSHYIRSSKILHCVLTSKLTYHCIQVLTRVSSYSYTRLI